MIAVKHEIINNELHIYLSGQIDSTNAKDCEDKIFVILKEIDNLPLIIDVEYITYISSAGLRIMLRILKNKKDVKVVNASTNVYEIFEMTGFTQMLPISKALRRFSVQGCEKIGSGANGDVYRIDPETIVKVYKYEDSLANIKRETELARKAFVLGIPTAIPYDVVKVDNSYGSVFELLSCQTMSHALAKNPSLYKDYAHSYALLLKKIHQIETPIHDLPLMKETAMKWAKYIEDHLNKDRYLKLLTLIESVPDVHTIIHGDYHTKNVMIQDDELLLIDMDTIAIGHPLFDISGMFMAYEGFGELNPDNISNFLGYDYHLAKDFFHEVMRVYLNTDDETVIQDVIDKSRIVSYPRLIRFILKKSTVLSELDKKKLELYIKELSELLDKINTLAF